MQQSFNRHIETRFPSLFRKKSVVAVSGGMDSVVLTWLCHGCGLDIRLAHCNFNLRGAESDADETFVKELAESLGLELFIKSFDTETYAREQQLSIQMAARELRYNWFASLQREGSFDFVMTAHHADDNLETFLINLSRGSGLKGLTGIPETNGTIVRPLLPFSRANIEQFAIEQGIVWREDSSNASHKYLRNALRHKIIPELKQLNPQLLKNFGNSLSHLEDAHFLVDEHIKSKLNVFFEDRNHNEQYINCDRLLKTQRPNAYLYEFLKDYGFSEWNDVQALLTAQSGKMVYSKDYQLLKDREHLILSKRTQENPDVYRLNSFDELIELPHLRVNFEVVKEGADNTLSCIYVDKNLLELPLVLRTWKAGDVFFPIGMKGKKKLSKYFKDEKLSMVEKQRTWLLCSGEAIVWVIGHRADNRFKVSSDTTSILKIESKPLSTK